MNELTHAFLAVTIREEVRKRNKLRTNRRVKLYSSDRGASCVYPIKALDNSNTKTYISYLIYYTNKDFKNCFKYGFEFPASISAKELRTLVRDSYNDFQINLRNLSPCKINLDGGDLGRGDNLVNI